MKTGTKFQPAFAVRVAGLAVAAALTACGGGGGGGTPAAIPPAASTPPVVVGASLVTSVPAANYTGEAANAFALLNAERSACGFGLLAQNAQLDAAAAAHAAYTPLSAIAGEDLYAEVPGRAGFSGVSPTARAVAKAYPGSTDEVMALGSGTNAIRQLLSGPYHLRRLMDGYRDVGIGLVATASTLPDYPYFVADLGVQTAAGGKQLLASDDVKTYPCQGTTGVNYQLRGEVPNPVPGRDLSSNPIGTPLFVKARDGNMLNIASATLIKVATGTSVVLRAPVTAFLDPNAFGDVNYFRKSEAYVAPDAALEKGTQYQATITGTNNGASFSRTFSFTTGTGVN